MDRVEIGDRVRAAAMDAGILPNDPLGPVVEELADIPEEIELRIAPILAEMKAVRADIERAARRPLLTSNQIQDDLLPGLLAAFEGIRALVSVILLGVGVLVGVGVHWMMTPALICGASMEGRPLCYRWDGPAPATPPAPAATTIPGKR